MGLMQTDPPPVIQIDLTARFKRDLHDLAKRYRRVRSDLQPLIELLQEGELPGDCIAGLRYTVFKVRLKNSNVQRGKSGGYRVIYYLKQDDTIILVTIYSKSDLSDIAAEVVEDAIEQYEQQTLSSEDSSDDSQS
jgi:mRNA-degrading endonuclease RelE of RelBE toxin-antitoxin system